MATAALCGLLSSHGPKHFVVFAVSYKLRGGGGSLGYFIVYFVLDKTLFSQ